MLISSVTMVESIVSLILLLNLPQLSFTTTYRYDNAGYIFVYDDSKKFNHKKAESYCENNFESRLATILDEDSNELINDLDPFADNATHSRECWIGLEYRQVDVYTPYTYLIPLYIEETQSRFNETANITYYVNVTVPLNLSYYEFDDYLTENDMDNSNDTYKLCSQYPISNDICTTYNTAPDTITTINKTVNTTNTNTNSTNNKNNNIETTITYTEYCYIEENFKDFTAGIDYEPEKNEKYFVCKSIKLYNYTNYIGYIWEDGSGLSYKNFYNYSLWHEDDIIVPTFEPTSPPLEFNESVSNWQPPTTYPTMSPTLWNETQDYCVSMDMVTGQWFRYRDCDGGNKYNCFFCDTNLYIDSNDDYIFHYDLTEDSVLSKNWNEANEFCKSNYQTKLGSVLNKDNDISTMSLVFGITGLDFESYIENLTDAYETYLRKENKTENLEQVVNEYYYTLTWKQSQNQYFKSNKHTTQSVWLGMYGYVNYDKHCYFLDFDNPPHSNITNGTYFNITKWNIDHNDNITKDDIDKDWIYSNLLYDVDNIDEVECNWTLNYAWIDNSGVNLSWVDFGVPSRAYPNINQNNWEYNEYFGEYSPENMSCVALYYNQTKEDWVWRMYPCYDTSKISWICETPQKRYKISGNNARSSNTYENGNNITQSATLVALIFVFPITLFVTVFCIKYYGIDKKGDFVIDCVDCIICTKCRANYQRQKAAEAGTLLKDAKKADDAGLAAWLEVNFTSKLSAVAAYAEDTETQEYLYEIHWPKEAQYWGAPARLNSLEYFIRLSSKRTMLRVWKVFDENNDEKINIKNDWSRVMYCWLAMYLIENEDNKVQPPPPFDRIRPIFDKISYELTHFLPKKEKEFMTKEEYVNNFKRWLYKICRRRQILLKRYRPKLKKERERLGIEDPNKPKDSNSSDEEPPILWNPGSIIFSDIKSKNRKEEYNSDNENENENENKNNNDYIYNNNTNNEYDSEEELLKKQKKQEAKLASQFSTKQIVPVRKDIGIEELNGLGGKKNNNNNNKIADDDEIAPVLGLDLEDVLLTIDDDQ